MARMSARDGGVAHVVDRLLDEGGLVHDRQDGEVGEVAVDTPEFLFDCLGYGDGVGARLFASPTEPDGRLAVHLTMSRISSWESSTTATSFT